MLTAAGWRPERGEMFAEETPLDKVTEATRIFKRLHPTLQDYALEQIKRLAET